MSSRVTRAALLAVVATLWLAGSAHAAFTGQNGRLVLGDFPGPLSTINANGTDFRDIPITFGTTMNLGSRARWSPDGTKVVFTALSHPASCTIRAHAANIRVANTDGTGQRDVTQPRCINGGGQHDVQPDWSPDGRRIVFASNRAEPDGCGTFSCGARLWVTNADGSGSPRRISPSSTSLQDDSDPEFSPDARRILFEHSTGETSGDGDLRLINADGTGPVALTSGPADDRDPDWSPDGSQIVFSSNRDTPGGCGDRFNNAWCDHDIYKMSANGTGITRLTTHAGEDSHPVFSPDGRKIAWEGDGPTHVEFKPQHDLYVMNSDGTGQTNITDAARQNSFEFNDQGVAFTISRRPDWQPLQTLPPALPAPAMRVFFPNEFISGRA